MLLTWRPPVLTEPAAVPVTDGRSALVLDRSRDYVVELPPTPLTTPLTVLGGRHVVMVGGEIRTAGRALYLAGQTGTAYVEGLAVTGPDTTEGVNLDQRFGATVVLQNVFVEDLQGSAAGWHADVLQTWAGPATLLVDRLRGSSRYQGMFLLPRQRWATGPWPALFDLRRVQLSVQAYGLWRSGSFPLRVEDVWVETARSSRDQWLWPKPSSGDESWAGVSRGRPPVDFVDPGAVGIGYVSAWGLSFG